MLFVTIPQTSITKCSYTEPTEKLFSFPGSDGPGTHIAAQKMPNNINK